MFGKNIVNVLREKRCSKYHLQKINLSSANLMPLFLIDFKKKRGSNYFSRKEGA
jgi:hypothetical protein